MVETRSTSKRITSRYYKVYSRRERVDLDDMEVLLKSNRRHARSLDAIRGTHSVVHIVGKHRSLLWKAVVAA